MGRRKGSRNKAGHKAGGDRRSLSASSTREKNQWKITSFTASGPRPGCPSQQSIASSTSATSTTPPPVFEANEDSASREAEFWQAESRKLNATREKLRQVMNHPSMNATQRQLDDDGDAEADVYLSDDDDDDDDGDIGGNSDEQSTDRKKYRRSYLPPKGSVLSEYLTSIKDKVLKGALPGFNLDNGQKWIPPQSDALSLGIGNRPVADRWYLGRIWVYVWMPLRQYRRHVEDLHPCAFCGDCNTHSKGLYWRPMFFHHMIVFVLHQRFRCQNPHCCGSTKGKRRTFASIDPRALSKLPTCVAERFEFVTTPGGPGMHRSMIYMFANLACKSILFGSFAEAVNELLAVDYSMECASYYGELKQWDSRSVLGYDGSPIQPYSAFGQVGEHNGIRMTAGLLKCLFYVFMEIEEPYMQASFQHNYDEAAAGDDTHKYSNKIFVNTTAKSRAQPFSASYTLHNKSRTISFSRLKFTKSHEEMKAILQQWKAARRNAGAPALKKFETDNVASDQRLWLSVFPELQHGVVPYDPSPNVPSLMLSEDDYRFFTTVDAVDNFVLASLDILESLQGHQCYYGLDLEWNRNSQRTSLLQVSFEGLPAIVLHLHRMTVFPKELKAILQFEKFVACGRNIAGDLNRLSELGVRVARSVELKLLAETHNPDQHTGLAELAITYCNLKIDNKEWGQNADYEVDELPVPLVEYGATDSILSRMIAQKLLSLTMDGPAAFVEPPPSLRKGSLVEICHHRRAVAKGCVLFIGNERGRGEVRKWGDQYVGAGKAIIQIDDVLMPGYKPPIRFKDRQNPEANWPEDATLGILRETEGAGFTIVSRLASLRVSIMNDADMVNESELNDEDIVIESELRGGGSIANEVNAQSEEPRRRVASNRKDNDICHYSIRSRCNGDIFHVFDSIPLARNIPITPTVYQLLMMATFIKNKEEEEAVIQVRSKLGITDFLLDEYMNREYYRSRIRMAICKGPIHASNIRWVKETLRDDPVCQEYWTKELDDCFDSFASKAERG